MKIVNWCYTFVYNFKLKGWYKNDQMLIYSCNYLKNGKCSIYWRRPLICREYPRSKRIGQTTMPGCGYSIVKPDKF
jgi:Fe-S-cluster containining protein